MGIFTSETVIPNGINTERIRIKTNTCDKNFTFLALGGRNIQKRTDLLMDAAKRVIDSGKKIDVIIVGQQELLDIVKKKFGDTPKWLTIVKPVDDINTLFEKADCFVSTSAHETFSYAVAEASIFGLPVIQSNIEGTMWNAKNPSTFIFEPGNVVDLAKAMCDVMSVNPDELSLLCKKTRKNNIDNYSLDRWGNKMIEFFQSIS